MMCGYPAVREGPLTKQACARVQRKGVTWFELGHTSFWGLVLAQSSFPSAAVYLAKFRNSHLSPLSLCFAFKG